MPSGTDGRRPSRRGIPSVEETSAGGLVVDHEVRQAALIARRDRRGRLVWSLPKGHLEEGETAEQAAVREVQEETGLLSQVVAPLGVIDYWFVLTDRRVHKTVHHFLLEALGGELCDEDIEVEEVAWVPLDHVRARLAYSDERHLVDRVQAILQQVRPDRVGPGAQLISQPILRPIARPIPKPIAQPNTRPIPQPVHRRRTASRPPGAPDGSVAIETNSSQTHSSQTHGSQTYRADPVGATTNGTTSALSVPGPSQLMVRVKSVPPTAPAAAVATSPVLQNGGPRVPAPRPSAPAVQDPDVA